MNARTSAGSSAGPHATPACSQVMHTHYNSATRGVLSAMAPPDSCNHDYAARSDNHTPSTRVSACQAQTLQHGHATQLTHNPLSLTERAPCQTKLHCRGPHRTARLPEAPQQAPLFGRVLSGRCFRPRPPPRAHGLKRREIWSNLGITAWSPTSTPEGLLARRACANSLTAATSMACTDARVSARFHTRRREHPVLGSTPTHRRAED